MNLLFVNKIFKSMDFLSKWQEHFNTKNFATLILFFVFSLWEHFDTKIILFFWFFSLWGSYLIRLQYQSAKGTEMTDSMKTWQKSDFL